MWGSGFISQKLGNEVMPPMTFNAVRQLLAAVFGAVFLGEMMSAREMAGAAIILAATVIGQRE